jgi:hypothetical protein
MNRFRPFSLSFAVSLCLLAAACDSNGTGTGVSSGPVSIKVNPCGITGTLSLAVATTAVADCSAGGTTLTLAGNGASYYIVPQFPTEQVPVAYVDYQMFTGNVAAASVSASRILAARMASANGAGGAHAGLPNGRKLFAQRAAEQALFARAARRPKTSTLHASLQPAGGAAVSRAAIPAVGSIRSFHVANSFTTNTWTTVGAKLAYAGANVLIYIDTLAPANGFTPTQLTNFGTLFDQTLYPIDTTAFGVPSDIDNNGHVIMLMSPIVNADTPTATCNSQGFVAGFFDSGDFGGNGVDSNNGEIFYSIVPDTLGTFSCSHGVGEVGLDVPGTFLHELQHLINYSQHVVISGGDPSSSWLDEGMSIVAEELGSVYYEQKCPPPACRTSPSQLFPDSSQGFVQDFLYDSYQYVLLPDTATITLSTDDENGFSWRGGAWLFARWLGDQMGSTVYRQLERGPSDAFTDVQTVTGQTFQQLFANFGVALYTDSLPGLPRATAPLANRFVSRNVKQLWARLYATSGGAGSGIPLATPIQLFSINTDSSSSILLPGTMTFFRLDTPASSPTVTIQFSAPGGLPFSPALHAQMAVFRLPPGQ